MVYQFMDIRFTFFCRTSYKNKTGLSPIVLRIHYRQLSRDCFTGLYCHPEEWDEQLQRLIGKNKEAIIINNNLQDILHGCKEVVDSLKYSGKPFTIDDVLSKVKGSDTAPCTIMQYLNNKVTEYKSRVDIDICAATLQKYKRCITHMTEFLQLTFKRPDIAVASINGKLIMDFFYYLRTEKHNSHNTSLNYIKCLKTVLLPAIKKGLLHEDPFNSIKLAPKTVHRGFLTNEEIKKIESLSGLSYGMEQVRDIFLFACYTGMAYIDIKQFSARNIRKEMDGSVCIHKPRQKTGILSIIPLLPPAQRILLSYSPTDDIMDFSWNVITNQKVNEHLKEIAKLAGIQQDVYFHLARHTFATTITLSNGIPLETVSRMLGHTNVTMTQRYAKISGYKIKEDMKKLMGLFN